MERKITHYVVKPEHRVHYSRITTCSPDIHISVEHDKSIINQLTEAKVLDLWCTPVYEKPRVKGWYVIHRDSTRFLTGPHNCEQTGLDSTEVNIFIDQEIE